MSRPLLPSGELVVAVMGNEVVGVDRSGNEVWSYKLAGRVMAGPVLLGDRVVVADGMGTIHALGPAGKLSWKRGLPGAARLMISSPGSRSLLLTTMEGRILEFARDGQPLLELNPPAPPVHVVSLPAGRLLAITESGSVLKVDRATGVWRRVAELGGKALDVRSVHGGRVLVATADGQVSLID